MFTRRYSSSFSVCLYFFTGLTLGMFLALNITVVYDTAANTSTFLLNSMAIKYGTNKVYFRALIHSMYLSHELHNRDLLIESLDNENYYANDSLVVILVQVHKRASYLKSLIESLRHTRHINETLLIFSHDYNSSELNNLVASVNFCSYVQLLYPYSMQKYPKKYPGADPKDCPQQIKPEEAIKSNCSNAKFHDTYKHYRNHDIVQIKLHWFWKLSYVFEHLSVTSHFEKLVVLLVEEDNYLFPDALHTLYKLRQKILSDIDMISLAIYDHGKPLRQKPLVANDTEMSKYKKAMFQITKHTVGFSLDRQQWRMIKNCTREFCENLNDLYFVLRWDDYNWDYTLAYLSQRCFRLPLVSIHPSVSRVMHFGNCGVHTKNKKCDQTGQINEFNNYYKANKENFFPDQFNLTSIDDKNQPIGNPNGGWADPRDKQLCKLFPFKKFINLSSINFPIQAALPNRIMSNTQNFTNQTLDAS